MAQKTQLTVIAIPGMVRSFLAKTEAVSIAVEQLYLKTPLMMTKGINSAIQLTKTLVTPVEMTRDVECKLNG